MKREKIEEILSKLSVLERTEDKILYITEVIKESDLKIKEAEEAGNTTKENTAVYGAEKDQLINAKGLGKFKFIMELELDKLYNELSGITVNENRAGEHNINKLYITSNMTDIVRIFEAMKDAEIISSKTTNSGKIAGLFFHEPLEKKKFQAAYNAIKRDIKNNNRNSNSNELANFIKLFITDNFAKKPEVLEELSDLLRNMQKNII